MKKTKQQNGYQAEEEFKDFDEYVDFKTESLFNKKFDYVALVLKSHLYFEYLLNKIIGLSVSTPKKIIDKNFSSKVDFLESIGLSQVIVKKLRSFNSIRNKIVHNYKYEVSDSDTNNFCEGNFFKKIKVESSFPKYSKKRMEFMQSIHYVIGYLHATKNIRTTVPLLSFCVNNENLLSKDKFFRNKKSKLISEFNKILDDFRK